MKNKDMDIREQIASLDTLSNGIVYDKDGAWGKLQSRMDKQPANKRWLYYGMAAALLCALIVIGVHTKKQEIVRIDKKRIKIESKKTITNTSQRPVVEQQKTVMVKPQTKTADDLTLMKYTYKKTPQIVRKESIPVLTENVISDDSIPMKAKTVQIAVAKKQMKTVYLSDIIDEEQQEQMNALLRQRDNIATGISPFRNMDKSNSFVQINENNTHHSTLKIKFN